MNDIKRLQNKMNNSGYPVYRYKQGDRVHLKGTSINGSVVSVVFKEDRKFPYIKVRWDKDFAEMKKFYDSHELTMEVVKDKPKKKKVYDNWYIKEKQHATSEQKND